MACEVETMIAYMAELTDAERLEVMREFCRYCGCDDPTCQCWNDE